jgi:hypothetical protein
LKFERLSVAAPIREITVRCGDSTPSVPPDMMYRILLAADSPTRSLNRSLS